MSPGPTTRWQPAVVLIASLLALASPAPAQPSATQSTPPGEAAEGRALSFERVVSCSPDELWRLWTTEAGVRSFFAPAARIEPQVGGRYEMMFDPARDPEGERDGTKGCRILKFEPSTFLAFEWKGREVMVDMNVQPLPTWVELRFTPQPGEKSRTQVSLAHRGFGQGGSWELGWVFFRGAWDAVMQSLDARCQRLRGEPARRDQDASGRLPPNAGRTLSGPR